MIRYSAGHDVTVTIPLVDSQGVAVTASAVEYQVINHNEDMIVSRIALSGFTPGAGEAVVTVLAANNTLTPNKVREGREVLIYATTDSGEIVVSFMYAIEAVAILVEGVNSFQTYGAAELLAGGLPGLIGWGASDKDNRVNALIHARLQIARLRFRYLFDGYQDRVENIFGVSDLTLLTVDEWDSLPEEFKEALRRAQVIQASSVMGVGTIEQKRLAGLTEDTVGESTQRYSLSTPMRLPLHRDAYEELTKYLDRSITIGRS